MKTWLRAAGTGFWFAALLGLAQLGALAATRGITLVDAAYDRPDPWTAQLVWFAWATLTSVVGGTLFARRGVETTGLGLRLGATFGATLGAGVGVAVALYQVRNAELPIGSPLLLAGATIAIAAAIGLLATIVIHSHPAFGWNATTVIGVLWLIFALSAALAPHDQPRLGVLIISGSTAPTALLPVLTTAIAGVIAVISRWVGHHRVMVALSGAMGAALAGFAYAIAGPGDGDYQRQPWLAALIAVGASLLISVAVSAWPSRRSPMVKREYRRANGTTKTAEIPITERDTDYVGWVSQLTEQQPITDTTVPRQRRVSGDRSASPIGDAGDF
jgi:hypothetical protein